MQSFSNLAVIAAATLLAGAATAATRSGPAQYTGQELAGGAKLSVTQARALALKARPGKIVDQELEKERGGSGLRYSFDVISHKTTYEVGVDAMTGKVLENGPESASKEAGEAKMEKAEKAGARH